MEESCEAIIAEWMELAKDAYDHVPLKPHVREYLDRCREATGKKKNKRHISHMLIRTTTV